MIRPSTSLELNGLRNTAPCTASQFPLHDSSMFPTVEWKDGAVCLLDQSRLPESVEFLDCRDYQTVAYAIRSLKVRGAPRSV